VILNGSAYMSWIRSRLDKDY